MPNIDAAGGKNPKIQPVIKIKTENNSVSLISSRQKTNSKSFLKKILWLIGAIIVILGLGLYFKASSLSEKIFVGQKTTFFGQIADFIRGGGDNQKLEGEDLGQINLLLLGVGGEGHEGPYLTDTMILAQIRPDISEITLTSIPRDYLVTLPDKSQQKINSAFAYGLNNKELNWDKAGLWARKSVEQISGLKVPYFAVIDFSGFEKAIDQVGGLEIQIENTFTDYEYPNESFGYLPPQTFKAGTETMDGNRALIFARSRHAAGVEGGDFARSLRQQKIIDAFKAKLFNLNLITDSGAINNLLNNFANHFHTNMSPAQLLKLYKIVKDKNMTTMSLNLGSEVSLVCDRILASTGAYVVIPCRSQEDIENYFKNSFAIAKIKKEKAIVWLATSTKNTESYNSAFRELTDAGIMVYNLAYSKDNLASTLVYQVNSMPGTTEFIKNQLKATEVNLPPPGVNPSKDKVDIIIVLGQNAPIKPSPVPYIPPPAKVSTTTIDSASSTKPTISSTTPSGLKIPTSTILNLKTKN
jgi:LCP family protein required for cell wall assembly